ncbi:exocyst complex component exo84 [Coccidioides immitis RMSCC 2394]|uniref:Exocyst complex component exo84 n=1 Tax=Coccidioides immitis RMSCC 2394 TaxID=404692 RepID=A0A0J7AYT0_COCIT|nr:exocyst complex component exo84 [Coccidioides immitis RMSCC 2394]
MTFRKTVEELRKGLRTEAEAAAKSTELISGSQSLSRRSEMFDSDARDKLDILIDVDGKQQNMKWVDGQLDELDINIALQQFEDAVARVEKLHTVSSKETFPSTSFQVSFIYFTMIKNTIGIYQQCFPSNMTSACIKWAKGHLDAFNASLSRQLSSVETGIPRSG